MSALVLVALPIGNHRDITMRAHSELSRARIIYAEDTRVLKELLSVLEIGFHDKTILSFHGHSSEKIIENIVNKLKDEKNEEDIFFVSDAGSPVISDPAFPLIVRVKEQGLQLKTVPGVTSVVAALELSGLPAVPFHFWGFFARSKGDKIKQLKRAKNVLGTHIYFESPHRIFETIEIFFEVFDNGKLVLVREMTKTYETVYELKSKDLENIRDIVLDKGEFVLLFYNEDLSAQGTQLCEDNQILIQEYLDNGGGPKKLAKLLAKLAGLDAKAVYDELTRQKRT